MVQYVVKVVITSVLVVAISESAKRWTLIGALLASLPLTSILALVWLYYDTKNMQKISELSLGIFWIVIPSLVFFVLLPFFVKLEWRFWTALGASVAGTTSTYLVYIYCLRFLELRFNFLVYIFT